MKSLLITSAAFVAALLVVLSTRLIFPAIEIIYYSILKSFEPQEPKLKVAAIPVTVTKSGTDAPSKPRTTKRRRSSSASTTATA